MTKKIRVGVIFGGKSGEHDVSVSSAKSMMLSLDRDKYEVVPISITKSGEWVAGEATMVELGEEFRAMLGNGETAVASDSAGGANLQASTSQELQGKRNGQIALTDVADQIDVIIPILHGSYGEDGTIQGMLEMFDVPYVGAGVLASAVGMDKVVMKQLFSSARIPQVKFTHFTRKRFEETPGAVIDDVETKLGYPCFVKPANLGSSVGISKAKNREQLRAAIALAAEYDRKIIVEEGRNVREIEVAVLGNDDPIASVPGEVVPSNEFYDYHAKYLDGQSALIIPAELSPDTSRSIRQLAIEVFQTIDCSGLARVDFFIEKETDRILVNEINTMPGFTNYSMYPKLFEASGIPYRELIDRLIRLGIERREDRRSIRTDFSVS